MGRRKGDKNAFPSERPYPTREAALAAGRCGAKSQRHEGMFCGKLQMPNGRCYKHGGVSVKGVDHYETKSGKGGWYSKYLPDHLVERYEEFLKDRTLLSLRPEISTLTARYSELLQDADSTPPARVWEMLSRAVDRLEDARAAKDAAGTVESVNKVIELVRRGVQNTHGWREVYALAETIEKLVASDRKRLVQSAHVLAVDRVLLIIEALSDTVNRNTSRILETVGPLIADSEIRGALEDAIHESRRNVASDLGRLLKSGEDSSGEDFPGDDEILDAESADEPGGDAAPASP